MGYRNILRVATLVAAAWVGEVIPATALPMFTQGSLSLSFATNTTANLDTAFTNFHVLGTGLCALANGGNGCYTLNFSTGSFAAVSNPLVLDVSSNAVGDVLKFNLANRFDWSNAGLGSFSATSSSLINKTTTGSGRTQQTGVIWSVLGNFTVGSSFQNAGEVIAATETWTLNQTGGGGKAISASGSYFSTAPARVPEPASLALLATGLLAAGARFRRKVPKQDA